MDDVRSNLGFDSFMERSIGIDNTVTPIATVGNTGTLAVTGSSVSTSLAALSNATQAQPLQGAGDNPVASQSTIPDGSYSFDQLTINKLFANQDMQSSNFVSGSVGWQIKGNGDVEFNNGIFRGTVTAGTFIGGSIHIPDQNTTANSFHTNTTGNSWWGCTQTNFNTNNDNATAYILSSGIAKFQHVTLSGGSNVIFISDTLDTSSKKILKDFNFGSTNYAGAVNAGNVTWNTTTGAITGGSGVLVYRSGIVGVNAGSTTFSIDATTGAATFAGTLSAPSGNIGGFMIGATTLSATNLTLTSGATNTANISVGIGSNLAGMNSANAGTDIAFWSGATYANRAIAPFRVNAQGDLTATSATINGYAAITKGTFGGDGSDGALTVTSGTTTIDCGGAAIFTKNYTSISITGTGKVVFTNPHPNGTMTILKILPSGSFTATSSGAIPILDASGMGAAAGASVTGGAITTNGANGSIGSSDLTILDLLNHYGNFGAQGLYNSIGTSASGGAVATVNSITGPSNLYSALTASNLYRRIIYLTAGAGGASGGSGAGSTGSTGGASGGGGRGGGGLYIECAGTWNFTITNGISVAGSAGTIGSNAVVVDGTKVGAGGGGGGGGGAAGTFLALYNSLTANTGTVNVTGGAGGTGGNATTGAATGATGNGGGGGGGGASFGAGAAGGTGSYGSVNPGSAGTGGAGGAASTGGTTGNNATQGTGGGSVVYGGFGGGGGGGGGGISLVSQNLFFF